MRVVRPSLWPGQLSILKDHTSAELAVVSGNGYGKTTLGVKKFYDLCVINRICPYSLIAAPSLDILKTVIIPAFEEFFDYAGLRERKHFVINRGSSAPSIKLLWRSSHSILLRTFHRGAARLRVGVNVSHSWIEEPGLCERIVSTEVAKRTRHPKAKVRQRLYTGTPEGITWFAEKFGGHPRSGRLSRAPNKLVLHGSTYDNPMLDPDYIAELEEEFKWNPNLRKAYILGEFVPIYDAQGYDFDRKKHIKKCPVSIDKPLYLTWDFNVTVGRAGGVSWVVIQEEYADLWACVENKGSSRTTFEACDNFIAQFPPEKWASCELLITGDASGRARDTKQFGDDYDIIEQKLKPLYPNMRIITPYANPSVGFRLTCCNRLFSDDYHASLYVDPSCSKLTESYVQTTIDETGRVKKPQGETHTHYAEAAGYAVVQLRPLKKPRARGGTDFMWA